MNLVRSFVRSGCVLCVSRCGGSGVVGISSSISIVLDSFETFIFFAVFSVGSGEIDTLEKSAFWITIQRMKNVECKYLWATVFVSGIVA